MVTGSSYNDKSLVNFHNFTFSEDRVIKELDLNLFKFALLNFDPFGSHVLPLNVLIAAMVNAELASLARYKVTLWLSCPTNTSSS